MSDDRTARDLEKDIEAQREELAITVDQLAAKLDVKSRAQARLDRTRAALTTDSGAPRPEVLIATGALAAAALLAVWWRRQR